MAGRRVARPGGRRLRRPGRQPAAARPARPAITSQNHGFAVDADSLPKNLRVTHVSLFDGSLQGIARTDVPAFSFQGHPEASPGPHDVAYLFDRFLDTMTRGVAALNSAQ